MRRVLVIRHAEAEDKANGQPDTQRHLTAAGRREMRKAAAALARLVPDIDVILSSPLIRAIETVDILAAAFPRAERLQHARLAPAFDPLTLLQWVIHQKLEIALVGHEPDLSQWIGYMTTGTPRSLVHMRKGSVCRLDMPEHAHPGEARIAWCLTPKQLARLG